MHIHFVTGRLAEHSLRSVVHTIARDLSFDYSISVLPITVAALMTPKWIASKLQVPRQVTEILLPGYCDGDLTPLESVVSVPVRVGPRDLRALPEFFGAGGPLRGDYGRYDIQVIAEINHAPRLSLDQVLQTARELQRDGADLIDIGCEPGDVWSGVGECVRALRDQGHRVSIDSLEPREIEPAVRAGAELVLSVNSHNRQAAPDWGCEVVVIPDDPASLDGFHETIEQLSVADVPIRLDPILEPIGIGFAQSLGRYLDTRKRYADSEMMMGIGNLTELTDVDSAAVNVLLLGFCEELGVRSVLTTQVINWTRSSVRECDLGRRLVHYAVHQRTVPKHLEPDLILLRDDRVYPTGEEELARLARQLKDNNYRLFADDGRMHLMAAGIHLQEANAFSLFQKLLECKPKNLDLSHAFYLGYELAKATTALTLGKQYRQDEALDWGFLTRVEDTHVQRPESQK